MKRTRRWTLIRSPFVLCGLLCTIILVACTGPVPGPDNSALSVLSAERLELLSSAFESYAAEGDLPGSVILVTQRGETRYMGAAGHRDIASGDVMETNDIFRIASQTKALVSVATMMLQEEGKLLIGHPVGRYLPEYQNTTVAEPRPDGGYDVVEANRPIRIRDLLTHTSGVGYGGGVAADAWAAADIQGWYFADREEPIRETVRRIAALPFESHPGERFVYGYSTDILGALVEVVSGMSLEAFLTTRIFTPLLMMDTHFYLPSEKRDRLATVYSAGQSGLSPAPDPGHMVGQGAYVDGPRMSFSGGAGLLSTAHDYERFLRMMLNGGTLDGARILSRKSVELMTTNHIGDLLGADSGTGFGLGFSVVDDRGEVGTMGSIGEYGWGGAYHSTYWVDPIEEVVVVYFTQLTPTGGVDDHGKLRALVYQAIDSN